MSTVQPYPNSTQWAFRSLRSDFEHIVQLALHWEPVGSPMSDDYTPAEADAHELWRMWVNQHGAKCHEEKPEIYAPWHVPIYWFVTSVGAGGTFEAAPHQTLPDDFLAREHFLTHFTHPAHVITGEPVNWLRLPVLNHGWNAKQVNKGGFIQEATGWKPSPLQPVMDVRQVAEAAGVYVP